MERIEIDPKVHFGKPCVAGTRVPVQNVLELIEEGISFNEIVQDYYPQLSVEDIKACVRYVVDLVAAEEVHLREASL
ncbi:MAG: antitoxin [Deltaproteobacteria bacterium CG_4_8_14_3_um_filter_51_11]|nr:DUF433 domain-containing protein [bacterium]OIP38313.1 MAG: antitoxin [Desulfobacteraceae bacterium CG2_30_51_40]PIP47237.1 MAG: antitoxin [Deltaproteobacteria bacterium CG23_combo_of_CG06-09_8_20_14_all_51_20]PIX20537.1 MAG: antitoxin [Deltaproteobacteria bacterium CG_4_8_14_3_um_filter_51_11]PIY26583.1 MAG: antitoxin [Deltaproteobacteria bacterium CG_4_10_14_3_um_filter_51_14]